MRILSLHVAPFARVLAIIYGAYGIIYIPTLLLLNAKQVLLPIGVVAPSLLLSFNFRFPTPTHFLAGVLCSAFAVICYAITGALTGTAAVLAFNLVAKHMGGVEATWVKESAPVDIAPEVI